MSSSNVPLPKFLSVRAAVLQPIVRHFADDAPALGALFRRNGMPIPLAEDPYRPIPLAVYLNLFEQAAVLAGDAILGARLGFAVRPGHLAPVGLRAVQAGTIRRGLDAFARYTSALQSGTQVALGEEGGVVALSYLITAPVDGPHRQDAEFTLAGICGLIRTFFDARWRPLEIHFRHGAPAVGGWRLERLFGAPVRFGRASNRVLMRPDEADRHRRTEDADMIALIDRHLTDLIGETVVAPSVVEQVDCFLDAYLGSRQIDLESVAVALRLSPRSLQRRLRAEGTVFSLILEGVRQRKAAALLTKTDMRIDRIAVALGYADGTAFWRAYRAWTGTSPRRRRPA